MSQESRPIKQAKEYIKLNYKEPLTLEEVAERVGLSPIYFSTLFKKIESLNYIDYLTQVRMDAAKDLLRTTKSNIVNIAEEVGYTDEKYFRKLFKKYNGIKPTEYRKLHS
jgi:two component transcriptional regulator, AraC family